MGICEIFMRSVDWTCGFSKDREEREMEGMPQFQEAAPVPC